MKLLFGALLFNVVACFGARRLTPATPSIDLRSLFNAEEIAAMEAEYRDLAQQYSAAMQEQQRLTRRVVLGMRTEEEYYCKQQLNLVNSVIDGKDFSSVLAIVQKALTSPACAKLPGNDASIYALQLLTAHSRPVTPPHDFQTADREAHDWRQRLDRDMFHLEDVLQRLQFGIDERIKLMQNVFNDARTLLQRSCPPGSPGEKRASLELDRLETVLAGLMQASHGLEQGIAAALRERAEIEQQLASTSSVQTLLEMQDRIKALTRQIDDLQIQYDRFDANLNFDTIRNGEVDNILWADAETEGCVKMNIHPFLNVRTRASRLRENLQIYRGYFKDDIRRSLSQSEEELELEVAALPYDSRAEWYARVDDVFRDLERRVGDVESDARDQVNRKYQEKEAEMDALDQRVTDIVQSANLTELAATGERLAAFEGEWDAFVDAMRGRLDDLRTTVRDAAAQLTEELRHGVHAA
ncbi:MAG: hypothetical protein MHM6MM_007605 [Cercozoa sp. M6MM]